MGFERWLARSARHLLENDPGLRDVAIGRGTIWRAMREDRIPGRSVPRAIFDYLRPSFHPSQDDNIQMARDYLSRSPAVAALSAVADEQAQTA